MDDWEKFDETSLPKKEAFYSNLNMEVLKIQITIMQTHYSLWWISWFLS